MKRRFVSIINRNSKISGYNVGSYPLHKFLHCHRSNPKQSIFPLRLVAIGDDEWMNGCCRKRINSDTFAVEFVQQGTFIFTQNGRRYEVEPGAVFLVHLDMESEITTRDYAVKKTMIIAGSAIGPIIKQLGLERADVIAPPDPDRLRRIFDHAYELCKEMSPGCNPAVNAAAYQVLLELADAYQCRKYPEPLSKLLLYMQENLAKAISVGDLCRQIGMSSAALHRMFSGHLNTSPIDYLIRLKMNRAEELLAFPEYSIKEISQLLGYSNQLYFSSEFKKRFGVSPKAYRNHK